MNTVNVSEKTASLLYIKLFIDFIDHKVNSLAYSRLHVRLNPRYVRCILIWFVLGLVE